MTFQKGQSGNPGGRRKPDSRFAEAVKGHTVEALALMVTVLNDQDAEYSDRLKAAIWICERAYGKAAQALEVSAPNGNPFAIAIMNYGGDGSAEEGISVMAPPINGLPQPSD